MAEIPFWKGKDSKILWTFEEKPIRADVVDWEVGIVGEDVEDDICGDDRARLDFVASHYTVVLNAKQQKVDQIKSFIASQKARDARGIPKASSLGFLIFLNDTTKAAFQCREYILGQWKMSGPGRKERNKLSIPGRCRYFDELKTI